MTESSQDRADADARRPPVETMRQLPDYTKDFLGSLRVEEIETIRALSRLGPQEKETLLRLSDLGTEERELVFQSIKLTRSFLTTGRVMKWLFLGLIGIFVAFNLLAEQITKLIAWFSHGVGK